MKFVFAFARNRARVYLSVLFLAISSPFTAQAQSSTAQLPTVVVVGNRVVTPLVDVSADVTLIDRTTLDLAGQGSLRDVLSMQPGLQLVSNGSYRSSTGVFLRGASSSQTIVMIDGLRVGSATSGGAPLENMPLDRIERIEILRGAASALYGPDAVGGVIQIFTREPTERLQLNTSVGAGSDGQRQASASLRGKVGSIGYSLGLSREQATGNSVINNPAASGYNPDKDGFTSESVDAKLTANLSEDHQLTLGLLRSDSEYQFDGKPTFNKPLVNPLALTVLTADAIARPVLNNAYVKWNAQWMTNWKSSFIVGSSDEDSVSEYRRLTDGALSERSKFNTQRTQATWQNDFTLGRDLLSVMMESRSESVDSTVIYPVKERDIHSVLTSYALNRDQWNALLVLRNDNNSQFGSFNNWAISGGYKLSNSLRALASLGTSFQAPTFNQLYYPGFGKATLTPQRNHASELGLRYSAGGLNLSAVLYQNEIQGFILPATNVQSAMATLRGLTLSVERQVGNTNYSASYDYADPRSQPNDLRLVRVAKNVMNLQARHKIGVVSVFGEFKLSSNREDNNLAFTGRDTLAGYGLLNVGATWKVRKDLSLLGRISNLTDANYSVANTYSRPGRNAFVSLSSAM